MWAGLDFKTIVHYANHNSINIQYNAFLVYIIQ